jgi:hypothetical protein
MNRIITMDKFESIAVNSIVDYFNENKGFLDSDMTITADQVYSVWHVKALQNFKGLFSTTVPDGMYYEITYNGDTDELYFDAYKKFENRCIKL